MQIDLQDLHVSYRDYDPEDNPPVLHQKELLVQSDYPLYEKFAKLSRQEADWGLLDAVRKMSGGDSLCVSTHRRGWQKCLEEHYAELKGHRVVWRKDADPYRVKLIQSIRRLREV
jgi:DNA phosphorothioation-associated putative methyltransferase